LKKVWLDSKEGGQKTHRALLNAVLQDSAEKMDAGGEKSGDKDRSPNDQRSDVKNPNNPEHKAATDNTANQLNPNNPEYPKKEDQGAAKWVSVLNFNPLPDEQLNLVGHRAKTSLPFWFTF